MSAAYQNTYGSQTGVAVFENPYFGKLRVLTEHNGELIFVVRDVAEALGYSESSNPARLLGHVPEEWKGVKRIHTPGGEQDALCLTEQGLYFFLARSDKPAALPFQKWLAGDVLPSIRRHGLYATPQTVEAMLADPDTAITLLQNLKKERERRTALEAQVAIDRPKVVFADAVDASHTSILLGDFAKILHQNGVRVGQKRLFEWMRMPSQDGERVLPLAVVRVSLQVPAHRDVIVMVKRLYYRTHHSFKISETIRATVSMMLPLTPL